MESQPATFSWSQMKRKASSRTQSVVPAGSGVAIPSSGECPEPFSEMAFIGIGMRRDIQHTCIAYQSMSKGYSCRKQTLSIGNNRRNTEIISGQGLRDILTPVVCKGIFHEGKEFIPYALNLIYWFISTGLYKAKQASKDTMYLSGLNPHRSPL